MCIIMCFRSPLAGSDVAVQDGLVQDVSRAGVEDEEAMSAFGNGQVDYLQLQYKEPFHLVQMMRELTAVSDVALQRNDSITYACFNTYVLMYTYTRWPGPVPLAVAVTFQCQWL
jgi:hypothetical protein